MGVSYSRLFNATPPLVIRPSTCALRGPIWQTHSRLSTPRGVFLAKNHNNNVSSPSPTPRPSASLSSLSSRPNLPLMQVRTSVHDTPISFNASRSLRSASRRATRATENTHEYTSQTFKHEPILSPAGAYFDPRGRNHVSIPKYNSLRQ